MRRKVAQNKNKHGDCAYATQSAEHLSVHNKPIVGRCPHNKFMFLLSEPACELFIKRKTKEE